MQLTVHNILSYMLLAKSFDNPENLLPPSNSLLEIAPPSGNSKEQLMTSSSA
jgi:hypothetical protein